MGYSFWQLVAETHWWFFVAIAFGMYGGFLSIRSHEIRFKYFILNALFSNLFIIIALYFIIPLNAYFLLLATGAILLGAFGGWLHYIVRNITLNKINATLTLPGSWLLLITITALFFAKFYFYNAVLFNDPIHLLSEPTYLPVIIGLCGLSLGATFGRLGYVMRLWRAK